MRRIRSGTILALALCALGCRGIGAPGIDASVIELPIPNEEASQGGVVAADLDGDGQVELIVTRRGRVLAVDVGGTTRWSVAADISLDRDRMPGLHAPGVQVGDVDGDGAMEVVFLVEPGRITVLDGTSGRLELERAIDAADGAAPWGHVVLADLHGHGEHDLLLQAANETGYPDGRFVAAFSFESLRSATTPVPLWRRDDFVGALHSGLRVADLDGDGRDEILGAMLLGPDGQVIYELPISKENEVHLDAVIPADVRPDLPGLEVVGLEEGDGNRVFLYGVAGLVWEADRDADEPQNAAVGEFDPSRPGLEIWCRSRFNRNQRPFVLDAGGRVIAAYAMADVAPRGWTDRGVEVISPIQWTGGPRELAAAKERHRHRDVAVFDPLTGEFRLRLKEKADRIYVADVTGDWREEVVVLAGNRLRIYANPKPNPRPDQPRLWERRVYRKNKMTWNYYNP